MVTDDEVVVVVVVGVAVVVVVVAVDDDAAAAVVKKGVDRVEESELERQMPDSYQLASDGYSTVDLEDIAHSKGDCASAADCTLPAALGPSSAADLAYFD